MNLFADEMSQQNMSSETLKALLYEASLICNQSSLNKKTEKKFLDTRKLLEFFYQKKYLYTQNGAMKNLFRNFVLGTCRQKDLSAEARLTRSDIHNREMGH